MRHQTATIGRYGMSLAFSALAIVLGLAIGSIWTSCSPDSAAIVAPWFQISGAALLLCSVLGRLGRKSWSWTGDTPAERLDHVMFIALNATGAILVFAGTGVSIMSN